MYGQVVAFRKLLSKVAHSEPRQFPGAEAKDLLTALKKPEGGLVFPRHNTP